LSALFGRVPVLSGGKRHNDTCLLVFNVVNKGLTIFDSIVKYLIQELFKDYLIIKDLIQRMNKEDARIVPTSNEVTRVKALELLTCYRSVESITQENSTRNVRDSLVCDGFQSIVLALFMLFDLSSSSRRPKAVILLNASGYRFNNTMRIYIEF